MKLDNHHVETLVQLGFSPNQAKIYLTLVMLGTSSVKVISQFSGVAREEVYRKLTELQELGVIEFIITRPASFKAVPMDCVFYNMFRRKGIEISDLRTKTDELRSNLEKFEEGKKLQFENPFITLIPEHRPLLTRAKKEMENLKFSLDTIISFKNGLGWISKHNNYFMKALKRNVKIRFLIQKAKNVKFPEYVKKLQKNSNFQLKSVHTLPPALIGIYDSKILLFSIKAEALPLESPILWSNNPSIVGMAKIYFETMWKNTKNENQKDG